MFHFAIHFHLHRQFIVSYFFRLYLVGMKQQPDHLYDKAELDETSTPSEKQGTAYQDGDDDIRPKEIANLN